MQPSHILIADDHDVVRRGIREILRGEFPDVEIGEAANSDELLVRMRERQWNLVLLDVLMPGLPVVKAIEEILTIDAEIRILVLTVIAETEYAVRVIRSGGHGYITKQHATSELINAVHRVLGGGTYLTDEAMLALARGGAQSAHVTLSDRELEVMCQIARGRAVKEIAFDLGVSIKTVSTYVMRIREKTGLQNYVEMTRYALQHNLVE